MKKLLVSLLLLPLFVSGATIVSSNIPQATVTSDDFVMGVQALTGSNKLYQASGLYSATIAQLLGLANVFTNAQAIQPLVAGPALVVRRATAGQTNRIFGVQDESNNYLAWFDSLGLVHAPAFSGPLSNETSVLRVTPDESDLTMINRIWSAGTNSMSVSVALTLINGATLGGVYRTTWPTEGGGSTNQTVTGTNDTFQGDVTAVHFVGDGSGLTGLATGTGSTNQTTSGTNDTFLGNVTMNHALTVNGPLTVGTAIFQTNQFTNLVTVGALLQTGTKSNITETVIYASTVLTNGVGITNRINVRTNAAYATSVTIECFTDVRFAITNSTTGNVVLLLTNCVPGTSGRIRLLSDATPRTISLYSGATLTTLVTNTVTGYGGTNAMTTGSKYLMLCYDIDLELPNKTNILWWAVAQP